jgi:hypothetical protein
MSMLSEVMKQKRVNTKLDELRGAQMDFQRNAQWGDVCLKLICSIVMVD